MNLLAQVQRTRQSGLGSTEVDIWFTGIGKTARWGQTDVLSREDWAEANRFLASPARSEFTCSRAILRRVLSAYAAVPAGDWMFTRDSFGRPRIDHPQIGTHFSLSHSGGGVLIGISRSPFVGVDMELARVDWSVSEIVDEIFSPQEMLGWALQPTPELLLSAWTMKEAVLKGLGTGLQTSPRRVHLCSPDPERQAFRAAVETPAGPRRWRITSLDLSQHHVMSVAWPQAWLGHISSVNLVP